MVDHYKLAHLSILTITKCKIHCEKFVTLFFETVFIFQIPFLIIIPIIFMSILYWMSGKFFEFFVSFHLIQIISLSVNMQRKQYFTAPWLIICFSLRINPRCRCIPRSHGHFHTGIECCSFVWYIEFIATFFQHSNSVQKLLLK